jgi:hopanoid biosynthesis associated RND transporter like protein HpnN
MDVDNGRDGWTRSKQFLSSWIQGVTTAALPVVVVGLAIGMLSVWHAAHHLEFLTGRNDLISSNKRYLQLDDAYAKAFHGLDQVVVVAESPDLDTTKAFVRRLGATLQADTDHVSEVMYRIDTSSLDGKKLLLLSPDDLRTLHANVEDAQEVIQSVSTTPGLNSLLAAINRKISTAMASHLTSGLFGLEEPRKTSEQRPLSLAFLQNLLTQINTALVPAQFRYHSPWTDLFGNDELTNDGFLVSDDKQFVYILVQLRKHDDDFNDNQEVIAAVRNHIAAVKTSFPQVRAGVTGDSALGSDEMLAAEADTGTATVLALVGVTLLYMLFFRSIRRPIFIALSVIIGLAWTAGALTLTVGHVTILSVYVAPILIGLCDAYGVYIATRYEEERDLGKPCLLALQTTFVNTAPSLAAGAMTTAVAFYAMTLADFRGVQELGFIAGTGVLLLLLAALTVLPALLALTERTRPWRRSVRRETVVAKGFAYWGRFLHRWRRPILLTLGVMSFLCAFALPTLTFDYNLLHLQAHGTESVVWEQRLINNAGRSSWYALTTAPSLAEADQKAARLAALPTVDKVETIASLVPEHQRERLSAIRALAPLLMGLSKTLAAPSPVDVADLKLALEGLKFKLRADNDTWDDQKKPAAQELTAVQTLLSQILSHLALLPPPQATVALDRVQQPLFQDFAEKWALLQGNLAPPGPITLADVPAQLRSRFVNAEGTLFLLQIYPRHNIWDGIPLREFIKQLRHVDPDVTGNPVIGYESIHAIKHGYAKGALYAALAIPVVTFFALRRVSDTVLALVPVACGVLWTAGLMWLCHLQFNLANLVAVPLIIGVGVDGGINLIRRAREEVCPGWRMIGESTGQAIALYSLDSLAGFGSLLIARHYGVFSMGLLLIVAISTVLIATFTVLPLLLNTPTSETGASGIPSVDDDSSLCQVPDPLSHGLIGRMAGKTIAKVAGLSDHPINVAAGRPFVERE